MIRVVFSVVVVCILVLAPFSSLLAQARRRITEADVRSAHALKIRVIEEVHRSSIEAMVRGLAGVAHSHSMAAHAERDRLLVRLAELARRQSEAKKIASDKAAKKKSAEKAQKKVEKAKAKESVTAKD